MSSARPTSSAPFRMDRRHASVPFSVAARMHSPKGRARVELRPWVRGRPQSQAEEEIEVFISSRNGGRRRRMSRDDLKEDCWRRLSAGDNRRETAPEEPAGQPKVGLARPTGLNRIDPDP